MNDQIKVLIIGGAGYIGSALSMYLVKKDYYVDSVDLENFSSFDGWPAYQNWKIDYDFMPINYVHYFDVVILLAGNSSVAMSKNWQDTATENVSKFNKLLYKLKPEQKFLFASSGSVYGVLPSNKVAFWENDPHGTPDNPYDASKQIVDICAMMHRNLNWTGLRFGTVCGPSPNMRWDLLVNSMYWSAQTKSEVELSNELCKRAVLSINDLVKSVEKIISEPEKSKNFKHKFVNLYSFNTTIGDCANKVSKLCRVPITRTLSYNGYSHKLASFHDFHGYWDHDNLETLIESLKKEYPEPPADRSKHVRLARPGA